MKKIVLAIGLSIFAFSSVSSANSAKYIESSASHQKSHVDVQKRDDSYLIKTPFKMANENYFANIFVTEDQSVILFNTEDGREVYKTVVDHKKSGKYNFYGYKKLTGQLSLEGSIYTFNMKNGNKVVSKFTTILNDYDF